MKQLTEYEAAKRDIIMSIVYIIGVLILFYMALEASLVVAIIICMPLEIAFIIRLIHEVKKFKKLKKNDAS
ncbi:hypothetical protein BK131_16840 [Paenibacillus amylolyticus]|uniref:Uncharacterized protein n=1 Tax=Paenibacillus amylolyticus TaxID=1451 RepID=A0A1R1BSS0_PAEAM|nr:hypothetical protein [Paenibacillus amylolyticus]OMF12906.1 hypothetical protein BK131_16840 [Paenibacillus amylolyticus]